MEKYFGLIMMICFVIVVLIISFMAQLKHELQMQEEQYKHELEMQANKHKHELQMQENQHKHEILNLLIKKENKNQFEIEVENILIDELIINSSIKKIKK